MNIHKIYDDKLEIEESGKQWFQCGCGCYFSFKVVQVGQWNLDENESKAIAHGLEMQNIIQVIATIINDEETLKYQAMGYDGGVIPLQINCIDSTNVVLSRKPGSIFDSDDFDSTEINRGHITIMHKR